MITTRAVTSTEAPAATSTTVSVVIPCLNEAETLASCIAAARSSLERLGVRGEILVIDNGSTDGSQEIARAEGARLVDAPVRGYGAALAAGIAAARGTYVVMGDADGSYDFSALGSFLERLEDGYALVVGNRFRGGIDPGAMPWLHKHLGNRVLTWLARRLFGVPVRDVYCGLRAFRRQAIVDLDLRATGMEFAIEMVVKASLYGLRVTEVPTRLARDGRSRPPHLRTWRDGWRSLRFLLIYSPRWLFFYPGMLLGLVGASGLVWAVAAGGRPVWLVPLAIAILVGAQSSVFAAFSKIFAISEGLLPPDARTMRVLRYITLEVGLAAACIVFVSGAALAVVALAATDGDTLLRLVLVSGTLIALGVQVGLSSFFLSILGLRRTGNPVG